MSETYSKEVAKEFVLQSLRLTPQTLGKSKEDVPTVVHATGGLQYGGHKIELFNRFENFKSEWFDYWYENHVLIEGHVLRGALRIINRDEYPYYFKATRSVARRRRTYHKCPPSLGKNHNLAFNFIEEHGPFTPSEFAKQFSYTHMQLRHRAKRLFYDLYNYGKIARIGRKKQKPLFHCLKRLPYKLDMTHINEKEAKEWLFLKCLSIYGPFTVKDVAHWVGWNITETSNILKSLLKKKKIAKVGIKREQDANYIRTEDVNLLRAVEENLQDQIFIRILFNDDALLLGYYRRLKDYFGYDWRYPQLSEGIVWRAAILRGRNLIGEAIVGMNVNSQFFKVKKTIIRREFATAEVLAKLEEEFLRHANFQNKALKMCCPKLV